MFFYSAFFKHHLGFEGQKLCSRLPLAAEVPVADNWTTQETKIGTMKNPNVFYFEEKMHK